MFLTIIIGWGMVKWADHNHVLILTSDRVEAYPIEHPGETTILKCGPSEIWHSFYALDMAIPLIPLHQEDRCEIEPKPGTWAWQLLWAAYSIIAKIITSLALITFSGVMKPKDE
jgi:hypothetical protein